jgi:hypothetical protein
MSETPIVQTGRVDFTPAIIGCIDKAFSRFGQSVFSVVYWKFQFDTNLAKEDIVKRPDLFCNTIREIFRDGSIVIERAIIEELKLGFNLPDRNYKNLEDVVGSISLRGVPNID